MGLLSFLKGLLGKSGSQELKAKEKIEVTPVVTPDPVVVDTESAEEATKPEKRKRAPKAEKQIKIEKKAKE